MLDFTSLYLSSMIGGWSPATAARSSASSFSSAATFFTIKPSKFKAIPPNPPSSINTSGPQIIASPSPRLRSPLISSSCGGIYRLCSDCCFDLFVCGVLAASAIFCADPAAAIVTRIPSTYPCEDVGGYYSSVVDGLEGAPLMEKLSSIVAAHRSIPYKKVWKALEILDAADADNPESSPNIIEIYSQRAVPKALAGKPEGWNREHLWPRSYGLRDGRSLTDLHNLRPADVNVNSSRGNKFYGECAVKSTNCLRPANREAAKDTETDNQRWAPPLQVRGDISRSLMYMALCYRFHEPDGKPQLQLSDSPNIEMKEMGLLSALLRWNELDPPSRVEQLRNDRICRLYQHNRNPFVDHPEYANLIWKHSTQGRPTAYKLSKASINEFRYKK